MGAAGLRSDQHLSSVQARLPEKQAGRQRRQACARQVPGAGYRGDEARRSPRHQEKIPLHPRHSRIGCAEDEAGRPASIAQPHRIARDDLVSKRAGLQRQVARPRGGQAPPEAHASDVAVAGSIESIAPWLAAFDDGCEQTAVHIHGRPLPVGSQAIAAPARGRVGAARPSEVLQPAVCPGWQQMLLVHWAREVSRSRTPGPRSAALGCRFYTLLWHAICSRSRRTRYGSSDMHCGWSGFATVASALCSGPRQQRTLTRSTLCRAPPIMTPAASRWRAG